MTFGASGTYISRNHLGGFLEMLLPLGLAYTLTSRLKPVTKVFLGYASLVILAGIAVTVSRGTYVSTAVALLLFFGVLLFHRTYRLPSLVLLVVVLGAGAYYLPRSYSVQARLKPVFAGEAEDRRRRAGCALAVSHSGLAGECLVGRRAGALRLSVSVNIRPATVQLRPDWAHNDYLNVLAEWGRGGHWAGGLGLGVAGPGGLQDLALRARHSPGISGNKGTATNSPSCSARRSVWPQFWFTRRSISTCTFRPTRFWRLR